MATSLISFPFRLTTNGSVATREDGDPDYYAEEIAVQVLTVPGERILVPSYGLADPTFSALDASILTAQIALFGPPVEIVSVQSNYVSDSQQDVLVSFQPLQADDYDSTAFDTLGEEEF